MKCVIPAVNIKIFGKAIQSLAKIGDEISIEPTLEGLLLKAVNTTRSCMAWYSFLPRFFQQYDDGSPRPLGQNSSPRYRLAAKCCLNVFKSLNNMDKLVEHCQIRLNETGSRIVFALHCKHGIVKQYNLTYMEGDPLNCSLSKGSCSNLVKAEHRLYLDIVSSFPNNLAELTLSANQRSMSVRNYVDRDVADPLQNINTTINLDPGEFEEFRINTETSVSFNLREVKAALAFAEFASMSVSLHFEEAGKPMFISMDSDSTFEMTFIVSTISESLSQSSAGSQAAANTSTLSNISHHDDRSKPSTSHPRNQRSATGCIGKTSTSANPMRPPPPYKVGDKKGSTSTAAATSKPKSTSVKPTGTSTMPESTSAVEVKPRLESLMNDTSMTLLVTNNHTTAAEKPKDDIDELLREIDNDSRSKEPLSKKAKLLFFNKKPPAKAPSKSQAFLDEILAEDSDDGD